MVKSLLGRIGRRGATAVAAVALAAGGVGLSAGDASAAGWDTLGSHPTGHVVSVYAQPTTKSVKVTGDLYSYPGSQDAVDAVCWILGENINNQGPVWYRVAGVYSGTYGYWFGTGYVYGPYVDGLFAFHQGAFPQC
ncbi:hypothetical protein ACWC9T_25545 [Kitasatospora sp. NPDC001159]